MKKSHPTTGTERCSRLGPALVKDPETLGDAIREKQQLGLGDSIINMIESLYVNMDESLPRLFSARALDSLAAILNNACDRYETGVHCMSSRLMHINCRGRICSTSTGCWYEISNH